MRQPRAPGRRRQPAAARATPGRRPTGSGSWRSKRRFGLRIVVGYAMSETPVRADLAARARGCSARSGRSASTRVLGVVNEAPVVDDDGQTSPATPASCCCATRRSRPATGKCRRRRRRRSTRTAGCAPGTSSPATRDGVFTFVARQEGGAPPPGREPVAARGGGGRRRASDGAWSARSSASRPTCPRTRSRRSSCATGRRRLRGAARVGGRAAGPVQGAAVLAAGASAPRTPTQRVAKHQLPTGHPADEFDAEQGATP